MKNHVIIGYTTNLFSEGLESIIDEFDDFKVIERAPVGTKLIDLIKNLNSVHTLVIEYNCPKRHDLGYIRSLVESYPVVKILLLSNLPPTNIINIALESGIDAYLLKSCTCQDLLTALSKMQENKNYFCSDITKYLMDTNKQMKSSVDIELTLREKQILSLLVNCKTNRQIAEEIGLSENTIKTHRRNIQTKFGVNNLIGMVRFACRANLIEHGSDEFCLECPHCAVFQN